MLQIRQAPLKQFGEPIGVPLYPVEIILLFLTIIAPTAYFIHPALSFKTLQIEIKYESKVGLNYFRIWFLFSIL